MAIYATLKGKTNDDLNNKPLTCIKMVSVGGHLRKNKSNYGK
jgi:hypothetical protein